MRGVIRDSLVELIDRKMLWLFGILTLIGVLIILGANSVDVEFYGQGVDIDEVNQAMGNPALMGFNFFVYVMTFLVVMATAGLIPNMLVKGRAEYFLSKPVSRTRLLLSKVLGVWIVYGAMISVVALLNLLAAQIATDILQWSVVYVFVVNLLALLVWLSITAFVGVVSGSSAMAIMVAFLVWVIQKILVFHEEIGSFVKSQAVGHVIDTLYYIFPKTIEMSDLADTLISGRSGEWMPVWSSLIFAAVLLYAATLVFKSKDY